MSIVSENFRDTADAAYKLLNQAQGFILRGDIAEGKRHLRQVRTLLRQLSCADEPQLSHYLAGKIENALRIVSEALALDERPYITNAVSDGFTGVAVSELADVWCMTSVGHKVAVAS